MRLVIHLYAEQLRACPFARPVIVAVHCRRAGGCFRLSVTHQHAITCITAFSLPLYRLDLTPHTNLPCFLHAVSRSTNVGIWIRRAVFAPVTVTAPAGSTGEIYNNLRDIDVVLPFYFLPILSCSTFQRFER